MSYIGNTPTQQAFSPAIDYFSGNGSTVAFTLSRPVASVAQVQVVIENVPQNPSSAFTVNGNTITFTSAPPNGTNNIYVEYTSLITQVIQPGQGTVSPSSLSTGGPYWDTSGNVGIGTSSPSAYGKLAVAGTIATVPDNNGYALYAGRYSSGFDFAAFNTAASTTGYVFQINGYEKLRIDTSDNVGIGTSSPASYGSGITTVDVEGVNGGGIKFGLSGARYGVYCNSVGGYVQTFGAYPIIFATNNTEAARIDSSGNFSFNSGYGSVATAYGCRAWVNFNGTGTVAIYGSGNVSSITDNGTGDYTVNFSTAMPNVNYAVAQCCAQQSGGAGGNDNNANFQPYTYSTGSIRGWTSYTDVRVDCVYVNVTIHR